MFKWLENLLPKSALTSFLELMEDIPEKDITEPTYKLVSDIKSGAWEYEENYQDVIKNGEVHHSERMGWKLSKAPYEISIREVYKNGYTAYQPERTVQFHRKCGNISLFNKDEEAFLIQNIMEYIHVKEAEKEKAYKAELDIMKEREARNRAKLTEAERNKLTEFLKGVS